MFFNRPKGDKQKLEPSKLTKYFFERNQDEMSRMANDLSPEVKELFNANIVALIGQMPEELGETIITTSRDSLHHLLYSSMVTGYVSKALEQRLDLEKYVTDNSPKAEDSLVEKQSDSEDLDLYL